MALETNTIGLNECIALLNNLPNKGSNNVYCLAILKTYKWNDSKEQIVYIDTLFESGITYKFTDIPVESHKTVYLDSGIGITSHVDNAITFTANTVPEQDLSVYIYIQDEGSGQRVNQLIPTGSFKIDDSSYSFEIGLTVKQFLASEYNTDGYILTDGYMTTSDGVYPICLNEERNTYVTPDIVLNGGEQFYKKNYNAWDTVSTMTWDDLSTLTWLDMEEMIF